MNDPAWAQWVDELEPSFKQKWMSNGIYELIMLSKISVISKPELVTSALLFWNTGTNTFDFRMGLMSPTILDMAQVFGLRPSGRTVDVTQDWVLSSTTGSSSSSTPFLPLSYNSATFKSYGTSFKGFIPFVKENFGVGSPWADKDQEHIICRTRSDLEWGALVLRRYPWFSDQAFQNAPGEDATPFCREKFISCIQPRDLAWGVRGNRYDRGLEVYHPKFCSRQLGFRQAIPVPFFDSVHCGTSFRLQTPSEVTFRAARRSLDVMSQVARHSVVFNFECTSLFSSWWEDKWTRKYGGDLKVNHDRIFRQLSLKSYPGSGELANWKEMIQEKNRLLLIAPVDIKSEAIESENDSADAAVLHGAAAEAERREAGEGTDVSESIGDSGAEETPKAITKASKRKKATMTKTLNPDPAPLPATTRPILTRKSKRARITIPPKSAVPSASVPEAGRKKQQSSRPQASKRPILASKEEPLRAAMLKKAEEL
ncbi:uncharacterized protein LOC126592277 [Malus sylvestris]|uniref:uncharacterized protein LOC126592277 n=1 Tax=Malus sylvestris TaxID=3752 RepID=UPI0021AC1A97|nr:uncharacterized protein LOC126592277 [Malus sylvestris]